MRRLMESRARYATTPEPVTRRSRHTHSRARACWRQVHFIERTEQYDSKGSLLGMESALEQVIGVASKLQELLSSLAVDHNYLSRMAAQEGQPQWEEDAMLSK